MTSTTERRAIGIRVSGHCYVWYTEKTSEGCIPHAPQNALLHGLRMWARNSEYRYGWEL